MGVRFQVDINGLRPGQTRGVELGGQKILIVRSASSYHAIDAICPHYQMPLDGGLVCEGTLRCPWHQSLFDLHTGHADEPPALDAIGVYSIDVNGGTATITLAQPDEILRSTVAPEAHPSEASPSGATDDRRMISTPSTTAAITIVGSGAAAIAAAVELRDLGFTGVIRMVSADPHRPYDRPNLSKEYLSGETPTTQLSLMKTTSYELLGITHLYRRVTAVDPTLKHLRCDDGSTVPFDRLLIATGGTPRKLEVPMSSGASNVLTLRSLTDANRIIRRARPGRRAVVIGSSFIAIEAAAALRERGVAVTIVSPDAEPFRRVLGDRLGKYFRRLHTRHGVRFRMNAKVVKVTGRDNADGVRLASGEWLPADFVLVGIGVTPATAMLPREWCDDDGGVRVDGSLRVAPGVYAAGDIARYPEARLGRSVRIEHWRLAEQHGRHAASAMLGDASPFTAVPYFWSYQFGIGLDYVGHAERWDELVFDGNESRHDFTQYFIKNGRVTAAAMVGRSPHASALLEWMTRVGNPPVDMVRRSVDWTEEVRRLGVRP